MAHPKSTKPSAQADATPLGRALEHAYATFASYRAGACAGCPCCVSPEDVAKLKAKRLRELSAEDVGDFAFSALNTWGTLTDYKHFFPRILELSVRGSLWVDLQTTVCKVDQRVEGEEPWAPKERDAVVQVIRAHLHEALAGHDTSNVFTAIESLGLLGVDVVAELRTLLGERSEQHATMLAHIVLDLANDMSAGKTRWVWWKGDRERVVERWLLAGDVSAYLMQAFEAAPEAEDATRWAEACDVLDALRGAS